MALPSPAMVTVAAGVDVDAARPQFEVADVVRAYGRQYLRTRPTSAAQRQILRAFAACRTATLGGHVEQCAGCSYRRIAYNSCLMGSLRLWRVRRYKRMMYGRLDAVWDPADSP